MASSGTYTSESTDSGVESDGEVQCATTCLTTTFPYISLHLSATKLKNPNLIAHANPVCILYTKDGDIWREYGRTELVEGNLNPEWVKNFTIVYIFEVQQPLLFKIYDSDGSKNEFVDEKLIGMAETTLARIVSERSLKLVLQKRASSEKSSGTLNITSDQVENCASVVNGQFHGVTLKQRKVLVKNEPFFMISKASESDNFIPIFQSEVDKKMRWRPFSIPYQVLCSIDPDKPLRITVFHYQKKKPPAKIGWHDTTFARLSESVDQVITLSDEHNKNVGSFKIQSISLQQRYNFYDYLQSGIQLNMITAIDFTASNRDADDPLSLHAFAPSGETLNMYEQCITSIGKILCPYDNDQLFPVFGFGAKVRGEVQHCFPLTFSYETPCVRGLEGIMDAYHNATRQVAFSGPTLFSRVIRQSMDIAVRSFQESRTYTILLILTDGVINDMEDTIDAIVEAGRMPLSIIIVGIGDVNFDAMSALDGSAPLVSRAGRQVERDLVQFVNFTRFADKHPSELAAEVLKKIPGQVVEWAEMNGIKPMSA